MKHYKTAVATFGLSLLVAPAQAESPWEATGSASFGIAKGNSDSLSYALQFLANYKEGQNEAIIGADLLYSENNGTATTDSFRLFGQYNRLLNDRLYFGANASYLTDNISDIDYRIDIGAVLGYYFIKNDTTSLSFEVGPGLAWENQGGSSETFSTIRFSERFEHQLTSRSKIWQSATFTPKVDDFSDYLLIAEAGLETALNDNWGLRTSLRYQYDSTPAAGSQRDDTSLLLGLSYSLGGFAVKDTAAGSGAPEAIQDGWTSTAAIGYALASGNSDSMSLGISADSVYRTNGKEIFLNANYTYGENDGATSADALRASAKYNHLLSDRTYIGAGVGYLRDDIASVNYRFTPVVTLGHYFIKEDNMTLSVEIGPGYTFEDVGGLTDDYFSLVASEHFTWEINERTTFKQNLVATFDPSNSENYLLNADALLDTAITKSISWRIAAGWAYDNEPAAGLGKSDTTLTTGISVKF